MKNFAQFSEFFRQKGIPVYRVKQIFNSVISLGKIDYGQMTDLPVQLRNQLSEHFPLLSLVSKSVARSSDGKTIKVLFELTDGQLIEAVLLLFNDGRNSICVSSQSGCSMGCSFCATGTIKKFRNLTAEEIFDQVVFLNSLLKSESTRHNDQISNIVFMGMGEPLQNYDHVMDAIRTLCDKDSFGFSPRRITISTCGLPEQIKRLAEESIPLNLAVSLHAPNQQLREKLMPIARVHHLDDLFSSIKAYFLSTGRRVSLEYVMLKGVNDSPAQAQELSVLGKGKMLHVNLIPYNATPQNALSGSDRKTIEAFKIVLQKNGVNATVRTSLGGDIAAACGQLANQ
jgi:23S rRNA (adenine2503-C2)-methyltransferase